MLRSECLAFRQGRDEKNIARAARQGAGMNAAVAGLGRFKR